MANIPTAGDFEYGPKRWILQMLAVKVSTFHSPVTCLEDPGVPLQELTHRTVVWFGLVYGDEIDPYRS